MAFAVVPGLTRTDATLPRDSPKFQRKKWCSAKYLCLQSRLTLPESDDDVRRVLDGDVIQRNLQRTLYALQIQLGGGLHHS